MTPEIAPASLQPLVPSAKFDKSQAARQTIFWTRNRLWLVLGLTTSLPLIAGAWIFFRSPIDNWLHQRKFDAVLWKADVRDNTAKKYVSGGDWPPRLRMVVGLVASRRLLGMTKSEVVDLLGPPDQKADFIGNRQRFIQATLIIAAWCMG